MPFVHYVQVVFVTLAAVSSASTLTKRVTCPSGQVTSNKACCELFPAVATIQDLLFDNGQCDAEVRGALRLAFHDAIGFSINSNKGGGADGSILFFNATELQFHANIGLDDVTSVQFPVFENTGLTPGDFVHLAAAVGVANCPGAPRLQFLFGRPSPVAPAPDLTVPEPTDDVDAILARFLDAGFDAEELVALLSAHTIGAANDIDPTVPGTPFDSTPAIFDTQFFLEVILKGRTFPGSGSQPGEVMSPFVCEMRLQSDFVVARDPRTACLWQSMVNDQNLMTSAFKAAMAKLQALGQDTTRMVDCSDVIPVPATFAGPIKYPPSFSQADVQQACPSAFPGIQTVPGVPCATQAFSL